MRLSAFPLAIAVSACAAAPPTTPLPPGQPLAGGSFVAIDIPRLAIRLDPGKPGRVSGNAGCNAFTGSYDLTATTLKFGALALTRMICPDEQMHVEARFLAAVRLFLRYRFDPDGTLTLTASDGTVLRFRAA